MNSHSVLPEFTSVEIYNPENARSQLIAPMNRARFKFLNAVAIAANGKVIVGGGGCRVEVYDTFW
jgi:hypothetical protein